jgi:hypothetical protein
VNTHVKESIGFYGCAHQAKPYSQARLLNKRLNTRRVGLLLAWSTTPSLSLFHAALTGFRNYSLLPNLSLQVQGDINEQHTGPGRAITIGDSHAAAFNIK